MSFCPSVTPAVPTSPRRFRSPRSHHGGNPKVQPPRRWRRTPSATAIWKRTTRARQCRRRRRRPLPPPSLSRSAPVVVVTVPPAPSVPKRLAAPWPDFSSTTNKCVKSPRAEFQTRANRVDRQNPLLKGAIAGEVADYDQTLASAFTSRETVGSDDNCDRRCLGTSCFNPCRCSI